jgi:hypothetical protein
MCLPARLGSRLDEAHRRALQRLASDEPACHCEGASELARAILDRGYWFAQEVYYAGKR